MTLYILDYNNYYNRMVKKEDSLEAYQPYIIYELLNTNFNPNDFIDTQHVIGNGDYDGKGDYLLEVNDSGDLVGRWFIIESVRTRAGQWQLTLRRDVIVDYYNVIVQSPVFIEKGYLSAADNGIFNSEDMAFDQILQSQTTLRDKTDCPWIVGYLARDLDSKKLEDGTTAGTKFIALEEEIIGDSYSSIENYPYNQYITTVPHTGPTGIPYPLKAALCSTSDDLGLYWVGQDTSNNPKSIWATKNGYIIDRSYFNASDKATYINADVAAQYIQETAINEGTIDNIYDIVMSDVANILGDGALLPGSDSIRQTLRNQDGNIIIIEGDKSYKVVYNEYIADFGASDVLTNISYEPNSGTIKNELTWVLEAAREQYNSTNYGNIEIDTTSTTQGWLRQVMSLKEMPASGRDPDFKQVISGLVFRRAVWCWLTLEEVSGSGGSTKTGFKIKDTGVRPQLVDAPWDMFCIPYSDTLKIKYGVGNANSITTNKQWALRAAFALSNYYTGAGALYDIQLLPYCPIKEMIGNDGSINVGDYSVSWIGVPDTTEEVTDTTSYSTKYNAIFYPTKSSNTFDIPYVVNFNTADIKVQSQCEMWRLCSPNYSGIFEFNVAKNGGMSAINVDYTYRPYNPYIHLNPNFGRLYGKDFNDARGLVCGGSFALPTTTDAWATYEQTNKTYQTSFNRQIQSQELQNKYQKTQDVLNAVSGTITGGIAGGITGAKGGVAGAIAGAVVGTVGAGVMGAIDVSQKDKLRNEALDLSKDQFGYNLENIQALPNSLSNVGTFTYNSKYFPFIEYYSCGNEQKEALRNKIKYNGMTIMRIGKITDYIDVFNTTYIKGKLIRLEGIDENYRVINAISGELNKGVYI